MPDPSPFLMSCSLEESIEILMTFLKGMGFWINMSLLSVCIYDPHNTALHATPLPTGDSILIPFPTGDSIFHLGEFIHGVSRGFLRYFLLKACIQDDEITINAKFWELKVDSGGGEWSFWCTIFIYMNWATFGIPGLRRAPLGRVYIFNYRL
ncbi:hypothetical protein ACFE04_012829 [Oxalis oulophora]